MKISAPLLANLLFRKTERELQDAPVFIALELHQREVCFQVISQQQQGLLHAAGGEGNAVDHSQSTQIEVIAKR